MVRVPQLTGSVGGVSGDGVGEATGDEVEEEEKGGGEEEGETEGAEGRVEVREMEGEGGGAMEVGETA